MNKNSNSSSQQIQTSFFTFNSEPTSSLRLLANAIEPTSLSFNQQQITISTFPQRILGGTPTVYLHTSL